MALSIFALVAFAAPGLIAASSVQTPTLNSCSSADKVQVSNVTITDATIGKTMVVNFTLTINEELASKPTLTIELRNKEDKKVICFAGIGSCPYKLCGGETSLEKQLGRLWNNECPVSKMTVEQSLSTKLPSLVEMFIGKAPTTLSIKLEVEDGGSVAGCQSFKVDIAAVKK